MNDLRITNKVLLAQNEKLKRELLLINELYEKEKGDHELTKSKFQSSTENFKGLFENHSAAILIIDPSNGKIIDANIAASTFYGWSQQELREKLISQINTLSIDDMMKKFHSSVKSGKTYFEFKHRISDGTIKDVFVYSGKTFIDGKEFLHSVIYDNTERKKAELNLAKNESLFRTIFEDAPLGVALIDSLSGKIFRGNAMFAKIAGRSTDEIDKIDWISITHPDDIQKDLDYMALMVNGEINGFQMEKRYIRPDGSIVWINMTISRLIKEENMPMHHLCMIEDITLRKQSEVALRESEAKYHGLFESMKDGVIVTSQGGKIVDCNEALLKMLGGYTRTEIRELTFQQLTPAKWHEIDTVFGTNQINTRGYSDEYEKEYIRKDGIIFPISLRAWQIKDDGGHPLRNYGIIRDITERKRLEEILLSNTSLLEAQLNSVTEGILVVNEKNIRLLQNQRYFDLFNVPSSLRETKEHTILLSYITSLVQDSDRFLEKVVYLNNNPSEKSLDEIKLKSGKIIERYSAPILGNEGRNYGRIWTFRDITIQKEAEEEIKHKNEQLQKLNYDKDQFFSIIAHDLRGPIISIMGLTQMIANGFEDFQKMEMQERILALANLAKNTFELLDQLLEWSKMESGLTSFQPQRLILNDILEDSLKLISNSARIKDIELIIDIPKETIVFADQNMLQTIIRNIISNAVKFTPFGGQITVSGIQNKNKSTHISVTDTGIGMSKQILDNLFRIDFNTNRPGTNGEHTTGLGLQLCRGFIEKHGGKIYIQSEEGKGSVISFTIPYHESINEESIQQIVGKKDIKQNVGAINNLKILIVDDDLSSEKLLSIMVKNLCRQILIARTGEEAITLCLENPDTDLILMDLAMPQTDGYEAVRQIRQFNSNILIIAQTAYGYSWNREKALEAGCNDYIVKPINTLVLKELINKYLNI